MSQTVGQYLGHDKGPVIVQHEVSNLYRDRFGDTFAVPSEVTNAYAYEHALPGETIGEAKTRLRREGKR